MRGFFLAVMPGCAFDGLMRVNQGGYGMQTQLELAKAGRLTPQIESVAAQENQKPEVIRRRVAAGKIVIPAHPGRPDQMVVGIGKGLRTKVNASIGTSSDIVDIDLEIRKARIAEEEGADTLMELSTGGNLDRIRRDILDHSRLPVGNVPLYQAFCEAARRYRNPNRLDPEFLFDLIEQQLEDGISFMAIHCGINRYTLERLRNQGYRYGGLVSKGEPSWCPGWNTTIVKTLCMSSLTGFVPC
jgi:phosphomethylpyrimidine synthase